MERQFTLEYWQEDGWFIGKLKEVPGIFSQGETLETLEANIKAAYRTILEQDRAAMYPASATTKEITLAIA